MSRVTKIIIFVVIIIPKLIYCNFPTYVEINIGETIKLKNYPPIILLSKSITVYDSVYQRIGASEVLLKVGNEKVIVPVGYENPDVIIKNVRLGVEVISDYEADFTNNRFHVNKDARIRISKADKPLFPLGSHLYPLSTPWNSGFKTQGWLTVCYNVSAMEGKITKKANRYHDGWDFGVWEGQIVRSVCTGKIVSPDDYPEFIKLGLLYNKNGARIGTNPFLVKDPDAPILYYYTHLSGLAKDFKEGEVIKKGEVLGYASARGSSGGWFHLHFSMIHLEKKIHINPFPFLAEWYKESLLHYQDFLTEFEIFYFPDEIKNIILFENSVLQGNVQPSGKFVNSIPGIVHVREAVATAPFSGMNHVLFDQFAILKTNFISEKKQLGEIWFGHSGKVRVYLNGELIYYGENKIPYHRKLQPFQWDSEMIQTEFKEGENKIIIAIEQTNPFWSFSIRPRTRLGITLIH